jgi:hypothetical protein
MENTIELFHKKQLGLVPKLIKTTIDELCSSKNPRNNNLRIPSIYKKGDLMYELLNSSQWIKKKKNSENCWECHNSSRNAKKNFSPLNVLREKKL